jgi:hypothetical protein
MSNKRKTPQPVQTTPTGYRIPVPQRSDVLGALRKAAQTQTPEKSDGGS